MTFTPASPWFASPDRTCPVRTFAGARVRMQWAAKDPGDLLDFSVFLHPSVTDLDDTVSAFTLAASPSDMVVQATVINGRVLTGWLSGGTAGIGYALTWGATLASGRVLMATGTLPVAQAGSVASTAMGAMSALPDASFRDLLSLLPTSTAGLLPGDLWNDSGVMKQVAGGSQQVLGIPNALTMVSALTLKRAVAALPTDPTGLASGEAWLDGGTVKVIQ